VTLAELFNAVAIIVWAGSVYLLVAVWREARARRKKSTGR
jgi:hypothetical protein